MIYYISINGLSTMESNNVDDSIKKAKYLKRKIRGNHHYIYKQTNKQNNNNNNNKKNYTNIYIYIYI